MAPPKKIVAPGAPELSQRDIQVAALAWTCLKSDPQVCFLPVNIQFPCHELENPCGAHLCMHSSPLSNPSDTYECCPWRMIYNFTLANRS